MKVFGIGTPDPVERRSNFVPDEAKFNTQKLVTLVILVIFAAVCGYVFWQDNNDSERSTVLQTVINLTILAVSYWMGSSKGAADNRDQLNKMITPPPAPGSTIITPPSNITVTTEPEKQP